MNKYEKLALKIFLLAMIWVFFLVFVLPEVSKIASTLLLFASALVTVMGSYATYLFIKASFAKVAENNPKP